MVMDNSVNWIIIGSIIDIIFNGLIWFIIALCLLPLIDVSDKWTRKALKSMDKIDVWIREFVENSFEWVLKKNLTILSSIVLLIVLGALSQLGVIPKLIT